MKDPRVDAYIEKCEPFALPILTHLREVVHHSLPGVSETIKWGFPNFEVKGKIICSMAGFKKHCSFTFWNGTMMDDPQDILETVGKTGMGHLGRITSLSDVPADDILTVYLRHCLELREKGVKVPPKPKAPKQALEIPPVLIERLDQHPKAKEVFDTMSYSHRKEYIEWIVGAKRKATQEKRLRTTIEYLKEGKGLNWKYERKK